MDKLDKQLATLVERALEVAEETGRFAIDQAPDLLREFYVWHLMSNIMSVVISIILIFLATKIVTLQGVKEETSIKDRKFLGKWYDMDSDGFLQGV